MSRCFPFPPPGYGARSEALIESIKLREEIEKKRREKIEKKRIKKEKKRAKEEKKEKRKEKKERKHKEGATTATNGSDDDKKFKLINDIKETKADGKLQKGEVCENELLERSGITEELEQPVTSREPCCLSDSTQSSKRKRGSPQSAHENGPAIKIRLPLRKHSDPEELNSKSKFHVGSSSGTVGDIEDPLTKATLASERQSKCVTNTVPKRFLGKSDSSSCKVSQNSVSGNAAVTKRTVGSDRQSQCLRTPELKRVVGNLDSRHGKSVQNSIRPDVLLAKNALGNDSQSQPLRTTEFKRVPVGNSVSRHGNAMQNFVHGDGVVAKSTVGSERQSQSLRTAAPNGVLGNSDSRHTKVMQDSVKGNVVVDKSSLGSDRQSQCLKLEDPKRVVSNSGKAIHNSIRGDSVAKSTLENDRQTQCLRNAEPKRVHGNSGARHVKAVQNLVHGEAVVTQNTSGSDRQSKCLTKPKRVLDKPDSKHSKALQNLVHGDAVVTDIAVDDAMVTDKAVDAMDIDKAVGDAMGMVNAVDDSNNKVESLYKSLLLIPPLTYDGLESLDQDWLFSSGAEANPRVSKKQKCDSDVFKLSSSMWPRAEYFPEVDVYALPYAVPF